MAQNARSNGSTCVLGVLQVTNATGGGLHSLAGQLFPGLQIGQVLGRGGYGTAYTGTWHDATVVVKVQDHNLANEE